MATIASDSWHGYDWPSALDNMKDVLVATVGYDKVDSIERIIDYLKSRRNNEQYVVCFLHCYFDGCAYKTVEFPLPTRAERYRVDCTLNGIAMWLHVDYCPTYGIIDWLLDTKEEGNE